MGIIVGAAGAVVGEVSYTELVVAIEDEPRTEVAGPVAIDGAHHEVNVIHIDIRDILQLVAHGVLLVGGADGHGYGDELRHLGDEVVRNAEATVARVGDQHALAAFKLGDTHHRGIWGSGGAQTFRQFVPAQNIFRSQLITLLRFLCL